MKDGVVVYTSPIWQWYWESGLGYWVIIGLAALVVGSLVFWAATEAWIWLRGKLGGRK